MTLYEAFPVADHLRKMLVTFSQLMTTVTTNQ
jgi:hypothetical protein